MKNKTPATKAKTKKQANEVAIDAAIMDAATENEKPQKGFLGYLWSFIWFVITLPFKIILLPFKILLWPFRKIIRRWFGPPPLMLGPQPVNQDEPDFSVEEPSMLGGQIVFILITAFFTIAVYWANTAELDEQVRAEGDVIPPSDVQIIQSRLPGSITEIHVELGSVVAQDEVLFRVEDADVQADFADNEIIIASTSAAIVRLEAEANGADRLSFPADLLAKAPDAVRDEQNLFDQRSRAHNTQLEVLRQAVEALERSIREKQAEAEISDQQMLIRKQEYDLLKPLVDAGHEPRLKLIEAETKWRQSEGGAKLARLSMESLRSEKVGREKEIQSTINQFSAEASGLLVEAQTRLAQAISRQESLAGRVAHADIRSPIAGTVSVLHVKTVGAVVQAGTILTEIVPSDIDLVVRAKLQPQDVADVTVGQLARISLSAYDPSRYGALEGEVVHVASNTTEEENQPPYYEMMVQINETTFVNTGETPDIVPGMQVTVDILGGKRTILEYILSPIKKATDVAFRET
ncbi:MAG: HlyD family type I secretion periplasmic adaptor subunit [Candidatus Puniceispirillaceae bacterium]